MATLSINGSVAATDKCLRRIPRHTVVASAITRVTVFFRRQAVSLFQGDTSFPCPCRSIQFLRKQATKPWYAFLLDGELRNWVKQQRYFLAALVFYAGLFLLCRGWILSPAAGVGHGCFDSSVQLLRLPSPGGSHKDPPRGSAQPFKPVPKEIPFRVNPSVPMPAGTIPAQMAFIKIPSPVMPLPAFLPALSGIKASGGKVTGEGYGAGRGQGLGSGSGSDNGPLETGESGKLKVISGQACGNAGNAIGAGRFSSIPRDYVFNLVDSKCEVRRVEVVLNLQAYDVPDQFEIIYRDRVVWSINLPGDLNKEDYAKYRYGMARCRIILDAEGKVIKSSIMGLSGESYITFGSSGSDGAVKCIERWASHSSPEGKFREWVNHYYGYFDLGSYDPAKQVILRVHSSNQGTAWYLEADVNFYVE